MTQAHFPLVLLQQTTRGSFLRLAGQWMVTKRVLGPLCFSPSFPTQPPHYEGKEANNTDTAVATLVVTGGLTQMKWWKMQEERRTRHSVQSMKQKFTLKGFKQRLCWHPTDKTGRCRMTDVPSASPCPLHRQSVGNLEKYEWWRIPHKEEHCALIFMKGNK